MNRTLRLLLILVILIAFPIISLLFLYDGYQDRLQSQRDLQSAQPMSFADLVLQDGSHLLPDSLVGKVVVFAGDVPQEQLEKLHSQFIKTPEFLLLTHADYQSSHLPVSSGRWLKLRPSEEFVKKLSDAASVSCLEQHCPYYFLMDTEFRLRRAYNAQHPQEVKSLVNHVALMLAKPRTFDQIELIREQEK